MHRPRVRLRVAVVIDQLGPGGAEQLLVGLAAVAPAAELDLRVISLKPADGPIADAIETAGVRVEGAAQRRLVNPRGARELARMLASFRPDVVHSHLLYSDVLVGLVTPRETPQVSTLHVVAQPPGRRNELRERLAAELRRRRAARIIAVSSAAAKWYTARHPVRPGQLAVIPNGVRWSEPIRPREDVRGDLGLAADAFVVAMVGVMRDGKGHEEAIAAVEELSADRPIVLLLAGGGSEFGRVEARSQRSSADVRVLGSRTDVPDLLVAANALVLPSAGEALPTVAIEAMAAGLPVVAHRAGGIPEVVADGVTGFLTRSGDVHGVASALGRLVEDPSLARRLGEAGAVRYRDEFTAERWVGRLRTLYEEVVEEGRAGKASRRLRRGRRQVDVLLLDASQRQILVALRALGRAGIRPCAVECFPGSPAFASRWCVARAVVPDLHSRRDAYVDAVLELLDTYHARVVVPAHDGSIEALRARRSEIEARAALALAREEAIQNAVDKAGTLAAAEELGVATPRSLEVTGAGDVRAAACEIGLPVVVKPLRSWVEHAGAGRRLTSSLAVTEEEAEQAAASMLDAGSGVVLQEWLPGRREAVSILYARGRVWARFAQVAYRMTPVLGGSSVLRESVPLLPELVDPAERLVRTLDLDGYSEVEFRRDALGQPRLMEINPRLSASVEIAVRAGVDFPRLLYAWAAGERLEEVRSYRTGLRVRWLGGDVEWLKEVLRTQGRPDVPSRSSAVTTFLLDFARPIAYDYVDARDPLPALSATGRTVTASVRRRAKRLRRTVAAARA